MDTVTDSMVYTWAFPGCPIRIELPLDLVAELQLQFRSSGIQPQAGGLLLGRRPPEASFSNTIRVEELRRVPSLSGPDGAYALDTAEIASQSLNGSGSTVLGWFRMQRDGRMQLSEEEIAMMRRYFPEPHQVAMLIASGAAGSNAAFFFQDCGSVLPFSLLEFPLDPEMLRGQMASAPRPPMRGKIRAAPSPTVPAAARRVSGRLLQGAALIIMILALAGVAAALLRSRPIQPVAQAARAQPNASSSYPFELQVEPHNHGLDLRWKRDQSIFADALNGRLTVTEKGQAPQTLDLTVEQLRFGRVFYQHSTGSVQFRLEVADRANRTVSETVLAIVRPNPSQMRASTSDLQTIRVPEPKPAPEASRQISPERFVLPETPNRLPGSVPLIETGPAPLVASATPSTAPQLDVRTLPAPPQASPERVTAPAPPKPPSQVSHYRQPRPKWVGRPAVSSAALSMLREDVVVDVRVQIDANGIVSHAQVVEPTGLLGGLLDRAALDAAKHSRFEPAAFGNTPVSSDHVLQFVFHTPR